MKAKIKLNTEIEKELRKYKRWRRWLWLLHPRQWWLLRKNMNVTSTTTATAGKQPKMPNMDEMLEALTPPATNGKLAVIVSDVVGDKLKEMPGDPKNAQSLWGARVFVLEKHIYERYEELNVNKSIVGPEAAISHLYMLLKSNSRMAPVVLDWMVKGNKDGNL